MGTGPGDEVEWSVLMDLCEGIEFGFYAPVWNTPPAPGPLLESDKMPRKNHRYSVGSKPIFVHLPTRRSLLRFLASQSILLIEPSAGALATSHTPTIFVSSFSSTRDMCLYMTLHTSMPLLSTRLGRALLAEDPVALDSWDTIALPHVFACAKDGLLVRDGLTPAKPNVVVGASDLKGPSITDQDLGGEDSAFITILPPFIELPVKMSDVATFKLGNTGSVPAARRAGPHIKLPKGLGRSVGQVRQERMIARLVRDGVENPR